MARRDTCDLRLAQCGASGRSAGALSARGPSVCCDPQWDACTRQSVLQELQLSSRSDRRDGSSGLTDLVGRAPEASPHVCARRAVRTTGYPADLDLLMCTPRGCRRHVGLGLEAAGPGASQLLVSNLGLYKSYGI